MTIYLLALRHLHLCILLKSFSTFSSTIIDNFSYFSFPITAIVDKTWSKIDLLSRLSIDKFVPLKQRNYFSHLISIGYEQNHISLHLFCFKDDLCLMRSLNYEHCRSTHKVKFIFLRQQKKNSVERVNMYDVIRANMSFKIRERDERKKSSFCFV